MATYKTKNDLQSFPGTRMLVSDNVRSWSPGHLSDGGALQEGSYSDADYGSSLGDDIVGAGRDDWAVQTAHAS